MKRLRCTTRPPLRRRILREAPDLILLDVVMPGKTGYELCRELKDDSKTRLIPIVMITGLSAQEDRLKGIEAGADDSDQADLSRGLFARVSSLLKLKEFTDELETADSVLCTLGLSVEARILTPKVTVSDWHAMPPIWDAFSGWAKRALWLWSAAATCTTWERSSCR